MLIHTHRRPKPHRRLSVQHNLRLKTQRKRLFTTHPRMGGSPIRHLTPTWIGWTPYQPMRPLASGGTQIFVKTQDIIFRALLPQTTTPSAQHRLAEYPRGYYQRRKHKLSSREATAQPRTSYTQEDSRTRLSPARLTSTKGMHPHPFGDYVFTGPRMRQETHGEDREVLLPRRGPRVILGKGGICHHPNRTRGYDDDKDPGPHHRRILHGPPTPKP